jgi:hypothetical protein
VRPCTTLAEVPLWKAELLQSVQAMGQKLAEESGRFSERPRLARRVEEALRMLAHSRPGVPEFLTTEVPWALDLLAYLERRREEPYGCTLPELFTAVVALHPALSITDFHHGLRRLQEHRVVRLLPFRKPPEELPQRIRPPTAPTCCTMPRAGRTSRPRTGDAPPYPHLESRTDLLRMLDEMTEARKQILGRGSCRREVDGPGLRRDVVCCRTWRTSPGLRRTCSHGSGSGRRRCRTSSSAAGAGGLACAPHGIRRARRRSHS